MGFKTEVGLKLKLETLERNCRKRCNSGSSGKLWLKTCLVRTRVVKSGSKDVEGSRIGDTAKNMCCVLALSRIKCPLKCHGFFISFL